VGWRLDLLRVGLREVTKGRTRLKVSRRDSDTRPARSIKPWLTFTCVQHRISGRLQEPPSMQLSHLFGRRPRRKAAPDRHDRRHSFFQFGGLDPPIVWQRPAESSSFKLIWHAPFGQWVVVDWLCPEPDIQRRGLLYVGGHTSAIGRWPAPQSSACQEALGVTAGHPSERLSGRGAQRPQWRFNLDGASVSAG
jgi:hypothetical protein